MPTMRPDARIIKGWKEWRHMAKSSAPDVALKMAEPPVRQHAPEIQADGHTIRMPIRRHHLVKMPIALAPETCAESVGNLNQPFADSSGCR
jgi:hypothetical protein